MLVVPKVVEGGPFGTLDIPQLFLGFSSLTIGMVKLNLHFIEVSHHHSILRASFLLLSLECSAWSQSPSGRSS